MKKKYNLFSLLPYLAEYRGQIIIVIATLIITSISILSLGKILKYFVDFAFADNDLENLTNISIISILIILFLAVAGFFRSFLINSIADKIIFNIRKKIYSHIINISAQFFEDNKIGDIISRITNDANLLYNIISNVISFSLRNFILLVGSLIFLFLTNIKLTLIAFILIFFISLPILFFIKKIKLFADIESKSLANSTAHIEESVNFIKLIQSLNAQTQDIKNFNDKLSESLSSSLKKIKIRSLLVSLVIFSAFSIIIIILWFGSIDVINGKMTSGDLSSFIFYAMIVATSLIAIARIITQIAIASNACNRLLEILDFKSLVKESKKPKKIDCKKVNISFDDVDFYYPSNPKKAILKDFNLDINQNDKIAIIGSSGIGKSSIFEILLRFYDVQKGKITINNTNIKNLSLFDLRSLFSYIPQDPIIFSGTIWNNISYGNPNLKKSDLTELLKNKAFDFITDLDRDIGQKGVKLSVGEKQRIVILRAFLSNSPIFLLDEFTSAIDKKNESLIASLLNDFSTKKTIINITHKEDLIKDQGYKIIKIDN